MTKTSWTSVSLHSKLVEKVGTIVKQEIETKPIPRWTSTPRFFELAVMEKIEQLETLAAKRTIAGRKP